MPNKESFSFLWLPLVVDPLSQRIPRQEEKPDTDKNSPFSWRPNRRNHCKGQFWEGEGDANSEQREHSIAGGNAVRRFPSSTPPNYLCLSIIP